MTVERAKGGAPEAGKPSVEISFTLYCSGIGKNRITRRRKFQNLRYGSRDIGSSLIVKPVTEFCSLEGWLADERKGGSHCEGRSKGVFIVLCSGVLSVMGTHSKGSGNMLKKKIEAREMAL